MASISISSILRQQIRSLARGRCEYCQTPEWLIGRELEIDHIIARANGGTTEIGNVCYACSPCNGFKLSKQDGIDEVSGERVALFHPRQQHWTDHFRWDVDGLQIIGLTACGRATIAVLQMNHPLMLVARSIWITTGLYPPKA